MIRTYKYGLQPPTLNEKLVREEVFRAHTYQNKLIEIERWRRDEVRKVENSAGNIPQLTQELIDAKTNIDSILKRNSDVKRDAFIDYSKQHNLTLNELKEDKDLNNKGQRYASSMLTQVMKDELKGAKITIKTASYKLNEARKIIRSNEGIIASKKNIKAEEQKRTSSLRGSDDAPWYGTYMLIEDAHTKTKAMPYYDGTLPNNPRFRSIHDENHSQRFGIKQYQVSQPGDREYIAATLNGTSRKLQIATMPLPQVRKDGNNKKVGSKDLRLLRIRIGTNKETREPIWTEFPMVYHRELPMAGTILTAQVIKRRIGPRDRWTLSISFDDGQQTVQAQVKSAVGFDLNWFEYEDRISIANWIGTDGNNGEVSIPKSLINRLQKPEEIRSIRDKNFDDIRKQFVEWITATNVIIPDWLREKTEHISKWKSQGRFASLITHWADNRFDGDTTIFGISGKWNKETKSVIDGSGLAGWKFNDHHLWIWETSQRTRSIAARNEYYRVEAAKLVEQYDLIGFEDINLSWLARGNAGSRNRQLAAPSEFRNAVKNACRSKGKEYKEVPARNTTKKCNDCEHLNKIDCERVFFCQGCGVEVKRDENAAKNVLDLACERSGDTQNTVSARINDFDKLATISGSLDATDQLGKEVRSQSSG
jgi:hypothetical protein